MTQKVIQKILDYIRDNNLKAGDSLPTEDKMREIFDVSRVSLREACSYLKGIGLLYSRRGSGFKIGEGDFVSILERLFRQVGYFDRKHFEELLELRKTLEIGAILNAVEEATEEDVERIFAAVDKMDYLYSQKKYGTLEYNAAESAFHHAIIAPARCRTFRIINTAVDEYFKAHKMKCFPSNDMAAAAKTAKRSNLEHRQIAIAFKLRQPEAALLALARHLHFPE